MSVRLPEAQMARFATFVETRIGLRFSPSSNGELERKIAHAAWENGFPGSAEFVEWLTSSPQSEEALQTLAVHLTIGETYFWRDGETLRTLQERIIPELAAQRRAEGKCLRIWSAGCATGEEPYSIAMLLTETIADIQDWNVTILATDINPRFIEKAVRGVYRDWSFRDAPSWLRGKYFSATKDGEYEISPSLGQMVDFRMLNLAEDSYPSLFSNTNAMDLVFCRNVLMYFSPRVMRDVVGRLARSLVPGGWLVVSPTEIPHVQGGPLGVVAFSGVHLVRKEGAPEPRCAAPPVVEQPDPPASRVEVPLPAFPLEDGEALALLARTYANLGRLTLAREWCEKAIRADPLSPSRHFLLATILEELGDPPAAQRAFRRALYADPDFVLAHFSLGHSMFRQGRKRDGERHLRNALALLQARGREETIPESEGTKVGRLRDTIEGFLIGGGS